MSRYRQNVLGAPACSLLSLLPSQHPVSVSRSLYGSGWCLPIRVFVLEVRGWTCAVNSHRKPASLSRSLGYIYCLSEERWKNARLQTLRTKRLGWKNDRIGKKPSTRPNFTLLCFALSSDPVVFPVSRLERHFALHFQRPLAALWLFEHHVIGAGKHCSRYLWLRATNISTIFLRCGSRIIRLSPRDSGCISPADCTARHFDADFASRLRAFQCTKWENYRNPRWHGRRLYSLAPEDGSKTVNTPRCLKIITCTTFRDRIASFRFDLS